MNLRTMRFFLAMLLLFLSLLFPGVGTGAQEIVRGSNNNTVEIPDGTGEPAESTAYISFQGVAKIHSARGTVNLSHQNPGSLAIFLVHPEYRGWERQFMQEYGRVPTFAEMVDTDRVLLLDETRNPRLLTFDYAFPGEESLMLKGDWAVRVYDTANDGITGFMKGWNFSLNVHPENPPKLLSWDPKNGSILSGDEVHIRCSGKDPDGDALIFNVSFYDEQALLYEINSDHLAVDSTRVPDGIYRIDFVALSMGHKLHNFDIQSCHIMVDNASGGAAERGAGQEWPLMPQKQLRKAYETYLDFLKNIDLETSGYLAFIPDDIAREKVIRVLISQVREKTNRPGSGY